MAEYVGGNMVNYIIFEWTKTDGNIYYEFTTNVFCWYKYWLYYATANFLNNLIRYIYTLRRKSRQLNVAISDAKISVDALQKSEANINTHFLYNALYAIAALAPVAPEKTETFALSLAKYYRYTTNRQDETWISIKEEVDALTAYLEVEKTRMGEKLSYTFDLSHDVQSEQIPKFLLQPLIENAIKYGNNDIDGIIKINIKATITEDNTIKLSVYDSGKPYKDDMATGNGISKIKTILKRLYLDRHTITFVNDPEESVEIIIAGKSQRNYKS